MWYEIVPIIYIIQCKWYLAPSSHMPASKKEHAFTQTTSKTIMTL